MTKDLLVVSEIATIVEDPDTTPMSVRPPTKEEKIRKRRSRREESPPRERRSRDDHYERITSSRSKDSERTDKSPRYPAPTPTITPREAITPTPNILKMKVLPV